MGSGGTDAFLVETRQRAARIDRYVNMIPGRFFLGSENQSVQSARSMLDPTRLKSTAQLIAEATVASGSSAAATAGTSGKRKENDGKKKRTAAAAGFGDEAGETAKSRSDLRRKLEERIAQMKEDRRRKQSDSDKTKQQNAGGAPEKKAKPKQQQTEVAAPMKAEKMQKQQRKEEVEDEESSNDVDDIQAGRLNFEPKAGDLPFEAGVGRRGSKVRQLRAALRTEEATAKKLRMAESEGQGEAVRKDLLMSKALLRARGEKVLDDVSKLRKTQKVLDHKKKKGKDKWTARKDEEKRQHDEAQSKRKENLKQRKDAKMAKRRGGEVKEGKNKKGEKK